MKYIFLDIDGVLNNDRTVTRSPDGYIGISDSLTKRLRKIIEATNASVVLTSTWKHSSLQDLAYMRKKLKRHNALPIGQTKEPQKIMRGFGINEYLKEHPCDEFVILDDFSFDYARENLKEHVVLTDESKGLTDDDVERAIKILNGDLSANTFTEIIFWEYHK